MHQKKLSTVALQFLPVLEKRLQTNPNEIGTLKQLGGLYRIQGKLEKAALIYQQLSTLNPKNKYYSNLTLVLKRGAFQVKPSTEEMTPTPFIIFDNFLPQKKRDYVLNYITDHQEQFSLGHFYENGESHKNKLLDTTFRFQDCHQPDKKIIDLFDDTILPIVPKVINSLGLVGTKVLNRSMEITATKNNQFIEVHCDRNPNSPYPFLSSIAFVYYFYQKPKTFQGGDILLYDLDIQKNTYLGQYTRVLPADNMLIAFPACFYHEVTKMTTTSNHLMDSRFAVPFFVQLV